MSYAILCELRVREFELKESPFFRLAAVSAAAAVPGRDSLTTTAAAVSPIQGEITALPQQYIGHLQQLNLTL